MERINLFGKTQNQLEEIALSLGEKKFRGKQLYEWIYKKNVSSIDAMKNLPASFRDKLKEKYTLFKGEIIRKQVDPEDGTIKYLVELEDGEKVESVLMHYDHGYSICISTQVGCNMGCTFCASGLLGKARDLSAEEMMMQVRRAEEDEGIRISNIVLMGMGEPLDNFDETLKFIHRAGEDLGIGQRHITLSTSGLIPKIKALADERLQINLALSLHSPFQKEREALMPVARANPLPALIEACRDYFEKTGRRVTYEYTLIDGENDREIDALQLKTLLGASPHHINLIPLNNVTDTNHKSSNNVNKFQAQLKKLGLNSTIRRKNGSNIDAACGQLRRNS